MNRHDRLAVKLQSMQENTLTNKFLIPLFKCLGHYEKYDFNGGADEGGKDIIFLGKDEIGDTIVDVVQVKRYRLTAKAGDSKGFQEIVRQLTQAVSKQVPGGDGASHFPRRIYLVTPYPISTRALQSAFESYQAIKYRVTIIDGDKLAELMIQHMKDEVAQLLGKAFGPKAAFGELNNKLLTSALQYNQPLDLAEVYTDIDFLLGRISTKIFFSTKFNAATVKARFEGDHWIQFKRAAHLCRESLGIEILAKTPEDIEKDLDVRLKKHGAELAQREREARALALKKEAASDNFNLKRDDLKKRDPHLGQLHKDLQGLYRTLSAFDDARPSSLYRRRSTESRERLEIRNKIKRAASRIKKIEKPIEPFQKQLDRAIAALELRRNELADFKKNTPDAEAYNVEIDGTRLAARLREESAWVREKINIFKKMRPSKSELKGFLRRCEDLFEATDALLEIRPISSSVGVSAEQLARDKKSLTRLPLSARHIFDTGLNFALLGEAGAGKTTTLVMAAKRRAEAASDGQSVFFVPLVNLLLSWDKKTEGGSQLIQTSEELESALAHYFIERGASLSPVEIKNHLLTSGGTLFLDGIDEVIKLAPTICNAIREFSNRYSKVQIIVSSRMSGEYLKDIPFLGVTLLPFTQPQLRRFIELSLGSNPIHAEKAKEIVAHLKRHPALARVVRSPLLATILCVLAKKNVPLPDSEIRLYQERMRLLLGHYDRFKGIVRINTPADLLDKVARKIAFYLNCNQSRYAKREDLYAAAHSGLPRELSATSAKLAVDELIDPCNILQVMTGSGDFGFGHLSFQEYFAACELHNNPSIEITGIITQPNWRGALILLAQLSESLDWLMDRVTQALIVEEAIDNLQAMIAAGPRKERDHHRAILKQYETNPVNDFTHEDD